MLGNKKGKMICGYVPDYVLFDLETTGTSCIYDEVIEISAVKVRSGKVVEEFSQLVNPKRPIPYAASMVNHISDEMVANEPDFGQVLPEFLTFAGDDILVGHNIQTFDMKFLYRDCERLFQQKLTNDYVDTLRVAKLCFPEWRHRRLSDLAEYLAKELEKMPAAKKQSKEKICPECGLPMKKRNGRFGEFWGCTGYPDCRHTENT